MELAYALKYDFSFSNNEFEYEALLAGLHMAFAMNIEQLIIRGDSQVVYGHVTRSFETKEDNMKEHSLWKMHWLHNSTNMV